MFKLFHLIYRYLKSFCVSSKHSEGMQPNIQHPIPFINFQNNWLQFQNHSSTQKSR